MGITRFAKTLTTSDIKLAASLMACGIPPVPREEVDMLTGDSCGNRVRFNFLPVAANGQFQTEDLMRAWKDGDKFIAANPEHPMAYLMAAWRNFTGLRDYVTKANPKLYIEKGSSVAVVDPNDSQEIQDHFLGKIGA